MQNPFTTIFSKVPDNSYISTDQLDNILSNFSYDDPSESVYKITGVRGSGKTVLLAKIVDGLKRKPFEDNGWLVCMLSPARDMLRQFAAFLTNVKLSKEKKNSRSINLSANLMGTGGGIGGSSSEEMRLFDIGIEIGEMLSRAAKEGRFLSAWMMSPKIGI